MEETKKSVIFDINARKGLAQGVNTLAEAVRVTLGPRGRNVVIERANATPLLTKDGVTVARAVNLREPLANLGAQIVKEAASRTADEAGDGTTTATVLAHAIFSEGLKLLVTNISADELRSGIELGATRVIEDLKQRARQIDDPETVAQVGTISANGEREIGKLLADALEKVGRDGVISVEEAKGAKTYLTLVEGMQVDRGYLSPYFITDQDRMVATLENPYILLTTRKVSSLKEILPILEKVLESGRSLLVVADDVDGDAIQGLVVNKLKGILNVCAIRAPGFGESRWEMLTDLSIVLGAKVASDATGLKFEDMTLQDLGTCRRVIVTRSTATFVGNGGNQDNVKERVDALRTRLNEPTLIEDERMLLRQRIAKLAGGVAIIHVGGATEIELRERKDRVDDALHATQAALTEGILPGGGVALVRSSGVLSDPDFNQSLTEDQRRGVEVVRKACHAPLRQIVINAGGSPDIVLDRLKSLDDGTGYDARLGVYTHMLESGIVDPFKVVRSALENAASAAGMMLTVGCVMIEDVT